MKYSTVLDTVRARANERKPERKRKISVRLPVSYLESFRILAKIQKVSMSKLIEATIEQMVDDFNSKVRNDAL